MKRPCMGEEGLAVAHKFDPKHFERLTDPKRLRILDVGAVISETGLAGKLEMVDVGAGAGLFAQAFLDRLPRARVHALDIVPQMVDWMGDNRPEAKEGRLVPIHSQESALPLPDGFADFLFMITLHHELHDPAAMLTECRRVLKPGAPILVADWDPEKQSHGGPPAGHRVSCDRAASDLRAAGFSRVRPFQASPVLFCLSGIRDDPDDGEANRPEPVSD